MSKEVNIYSEEFKQSSAKLAVESNQSIAQTAKNLGVNVNTLHGWIKKYTRQLKNKTLPNEPNLYEEVQQLKKENARLKQERDILKKAAAYFANQMP